MIKFRLYWDKDKETAWLNEMSAKGYAMTGFFAGIFVFDKCEPGKYLYQVDFGEKLFRVSDDYRQFMEETGVEIVQTWGFWVVLRKLASEGKFELYTDVDSSIEHYKKILKMFKVVTILELLCFFIEVWGAIQGNTAATAFMFLLGALILLNAINKTKSIIAELMERKGETMLQNRNRLYSPALACGLLLNGVVYLQDIANPILRHGIQIVALVLMVAGLIHQRVKFRNQENI